LGDRRLGDTPFEDEKMADGGEAWRREGIRLGPGGILERERRQFRVFHVT